MKNSIVSLSLAMVILSSCATQKVGTYTDDVYANPSEDRIEEARLAAIAKQEAEAREKHYNDSIASIRKAQKDKDDANPYYKDREFKYDDYYDYEYATRVKRFNNGINGLSYYDNYYTNSYWYNKNPYNYGVSVYNGYSWWGSGYNNYSYNPSVNFYNSFGWSSCPNYGYNGYNPYTPYGYGFSSGIHFGYSQGWGNNPYYGFGNGFGYGNPYGYGGGYGYNPYGYGYGYNNPYNNNGWGYYNSYDNNSSYSYGPRSSHGGGNAHRTTNPGVRSSTDDGYYNKYVTAVNDQQNRSQKFETVSTPRTVSHEDRGIRNNNINNSNIDNNTGRPNTQVNTDDTRPSRGNHGVYQNNNSTNQPIKIDNPPVRGNDEPVRGGNTGGVKPVRDLNNHSETAPSRDNQRQQQSSPSHNTSPSSPGGNGNGSGGHRPR